MMTLYDLYHAPLRRIGISELSLLIEFLGGAAPMQSYGTIKGKDWFFRSRWDEWSFVVALMPDADPLDGGLASNDCFFIKRQTYGTPNSYQASYIPIETALNLIAECAEEALFYLDDQ